MKNRYLKFIDMIKKWIPIIVDKSRLLIMALPFFAMDLITRLFGYKIDICDAWNYSPNFFTICWVVFFLNLSVNFSNKIGKKIYLIFSTFFFILFLVHNVYYSTTGTFFNFHLLTAAKEGSSYIIDVIKNCDIKVYLAGLFIVFVIFLGYKNFPTNNKNRRSTLIFVSIWCLILHFIVPFSLGYSHNDLNYGAWLNLKDNYIAFNDSNKSMKISGLFEYTFRDFYITYLKPKEKQTPEIKEFLDNAFQKTEEHNNNYSGIFKDKNLIFVQLEGIDNWLISEEITPTLYNMMHNSYNFTNHYSYYSGGGSTFNSELAVNTGFITPLSYVQNPFTLNKNDFPYSMANLFKNEGYSVNAFHMNSGEFYSRSVNYPNWGYDNYYGLISIQDYNNDRHFLDRELILNEKFNQLMFHNNDKFVNYIITYSNHMPFTRTTGVCKILYELDNNNKFMSEEDCVKRQAQETDYMMKLLLQNLEEKDMLDDTIIVAFTDHYLYTLNNKSILNKYKDTNTNLINHTPFFIWGNDIEPTVINKVTSQIDILPTVLNLFGLYNNPNNYIGKDALDPNYEGIVFFSDYSWYDGNVYVVDGIVKNNNQINPDELSKKNDYVSYVAKKNDFALKFNYFKK